MTTINAVDIGLSGASGTGSFAGTVSPEFVTPTIGAATATSLVFSPSIGGIIGTATNNNAGAGDVGEFVSNVLSTGSAIALTSATATNVTSISLTAGDWDVWGNVYILGGNAGSTIFAGWISTTSASIPDASLSSEYVATFTANTQWSFCVPQLRFSLAATTTIYLEAFCTYTGIGSGAAGGIYARRIR